MNKQYNIVWNSARNMYVVASEFACGDSRIKSQVRAGGLVAALIFASSASYAVDNTFITETGKVNTISGSYTGTSTAISAIGTGTIVEDSGAININVDNINNHTAFYGISVGKNAQLILDNPDNVVTINSGGSADAAIYINSNATASINGGTYNASGAEAYGIYLQGSGSLDLKNAVVNTSGTKFSFGVYVWGNGTSTTLDNDILNTTGEASSALRFSDATGTLTANNITLTTQGLSSYALLNVKGTMDLNDLTITTSGYDATGIYSSDKTTASDVNITTTGEKSHGAEVANGALTLNGGTVQASGTDAYGLLVTKGSMAISDLDVSSAQSYGVALQNGTTTSATNSNVKGTGAGYYLDKTSGSAATALTVDGGSVTSTTEGGSAFLVNAGVANINVKNLKSVNADNLLTVNNTTDAMTFTAENSQLSGAVNAGGNNVSMALDNASQWMMTGDSNVGNLTSSGRITLGDENGNRGTLNAGNLTLQSGSTTDVWVSTSATAAPITADNASLGGTLNITGFAGSEDPSKIATATVIDANSAISGDFSKITIAGMENADFLSLDGHINSVDNTQYDVSTSLSWFANSDDAHGTFTIDDADENFTIDTVLDDQTANPATGWDGESLIKEGDGTLILDAENTYSGDTHVNDGTLWVTDEGAIGVEGSDQTIYVAEGATFGGDNGTANANVINDGTVKFDDTLTINGDMTNSGTIASGDVTGDSATSGNTLVINGDYIANDGKLIINTELGDDSSPTDILVVNGDTSGNTTVYINNTGGEGAQTDKGIKIIDVNGASNGEFTQGN